jgi:hypothetical protein
MKMKNEEMLDPRLREYLELLRPVPRRDPVAAARAKANFLAELEVLFEPSQTVQAKPLAPPGIFGFVRSLAKRPFSSQNSLPRTALSFSSVLLIVAVLLFGWVGITARAAESALPGDTLYSFKTSMEQVELALSGDLDKQVGLYLEFASHRLQEIEQLVDAGRYQKAAALSTRFHLNIQKAIEITAELAKVNPARAEQRRNEINSKLVGFAVQLNELMGKMPPVYQPAFNTAIPPSQSNTPVSTPLGVAPTPYPGVEQDTPQNEPSDIPNLPANDSDTGLNPKGDSGSDQEKNSGESPLSGSDSSGSHEAPDEINEGTDPGFAPETHSGNNPESNPENNNENPEAQHSLSPANPGSSHSREGDPSSQNGQNSGDHQNISPESGITYALPAISQ